MTRSRPANRSSVAPDSRSGQHLPGKCFDQLEPRMLLSGVNDAQAEPREIEAIGWFGAEIEAYVGSYIFTFAEGTTGAQSEQLTRDLATQLGIRVDSVRALGRGHFTLLQTPDALNQQRLAAIIAEDNPYLGVMPDLVYHPQSIPNDPFFSQQYYHDNTGQSIGGQLGTLDADIDTTDAWDITTGSSDVIIAVIDTGVDMDHPDLAANIWRNPGEIPGNGIDDDGNGFVDDVNGWDFGELDNDPDDSPDTGGHGTPVAGLIGAVGDNGIGIAGVNWQVSILPLKIADRFGALSSSAIIGAHEYLTMMRNRGVNIVASNNSYGAFAPNFFDDLPDGLQGEAAAIEAFIASGGVFVASAGNAGNDNDSIFTAYPASYDIPGIISVAASDNNDDLAGFSNFGARNVDLAAPGVNTISTGVGGGYTNFGGTSAAGPIVAGAVGLLKSLRPQSSGEEIRNVLINSVDIVPSLQGLVQSGGRLNVLRALEILGIDGPIVTAIDPGPVVGQLDSAGAVRDTVTIVFDQALNTSALNSSFVSLVGLGNDAQLGTADDFTVPVTSITAVDSRTVDVELNVAGFLQQRLPIGQYQLTLSAAGFVDIDGNFLNGDSVNGNDEVYSFRVAAASGSLEPNDALATAVPVNFIASGTASFTGLVIGDGVNTVRDVDLFAVQIPRGGLIRAEVLGARRAGGSSLDGYLRLFDASGNELAANDQFFGADPLIDFFVPTGGTYYVGVSAFPNDSYNATQAASGVSQVGGVYDLVITTELVENDRVSASVDLSSTPLRLPPVGDQGVFSNSLFFPDSRRIIDLNVRINLQHDFVGDLEISLISPQGTQVLLANRVGGNGDDYQNTLFDDEATLSINLGTAPFNRAGGYQPTEALSAFDGESAGGNWTILIRDRSPLNTGFFLGWSLEATVASDIFGPFELNDTVLTATPTGISGGGSAQFAAELGDGGFGLFDRDLYRFEAVNGSTLTATVTPTDETFNSSLALFDSDGNLLRLSNPSGTRSSTIQQFVFVTGGTFYLGIADQTNVAYNPLIPGSGVAATSTGAYTLSIALGQGISDSARVLIADTVAHGTRGDGTFFANNVGIQRNGIEFLFGPGGQSQSFFGASAGGFFFRNDGPGGEANLPIALTDQSDATNRRMLAQGQFQGLAVERAVSYANGDSFLAIDVTLTNDTAGTISNIAWMEALNPQQGLQFVQNSTAATSNNIIDGQPAAFASYTSPQFPGGLTMALVAPAADGRAQATFYDPSESVRDPNRLLAAGVNDPDGAVADLGMAMAFNLGTLTPGERVSMRYFVLLGTTNAEVVDLYGQINDGTGTGHLAADPANPASEALLVAAGDSQDTAPTLPFRLYYPEGFSNANTSTFVPILNPNSQATRVFIIARYETGARDEVLADLTIPAESRSGITITTPQLFASNDALVRGLTPYALELRSERPVAATFSHYDLFLLADARAAIGETFTNRGETSWSFATVNKGTGQRDFLLFQNTSEEPVKVTTTFFNEQGDSFSITQELEALRRGGLDVRNFTLPSGDRLPAGNYGVQITADQPIVAVISSFDAVAGVSSGNLGQEGGGATGGVSPEGQLGLNATSERIGILNPNATRANIVFTFLFQNGTSYRTTAEVNRETRSSIDVATLPNFPLGQPYSVRYSSNVPVALDLPTAVFGDEFSSSFTGRAYTLWGFGEGFRPRNESMVTEYLRLFNPSTEDTVVEITLHFDGGFASETFRRTLPAQRVQEFNLFDFVTGDRRNQKVFFGTVVKSATPIVAAMGHFDAFFPGGFGALGTPLGTATNII